MKDKNKKFTKLFHFTTDNSSVGAVCSLSKGNLVLCESSSGHLWFVSFDSKGINKSKLLPVAEGEFYESSLHVLPSHPRIVVLSLKRCCIESIVLPSGHKLWDIDGEVDGHELDVHGITSKGSNHIFVADGENKRVLEFDAEGEYKRTVISHEDHDVGDVYGVAWDDKNNLLVVLHGEDDQVMYIEKFKIPFDY